MVITGRKMFQILMHIFLIFNPNYKGISTIYKTAGFSVRCIKD